MLNISSGRKLHQCFSSPWLFNTPPLSYSRVCLPVYNTIDNEYFYFKGDRRSAFHNGIKEKICPLSHQVLRFLVRLQPFQAPMVIACLLSATRAAQEYVDTNAAAKQAGQAPGSLPWDQQNGSRFLLRDRCFLISFFPLGCQRAAWCARGIAPHAVLYRAT